MFYANRISLLFLCILLFITLTSCKTKTERKNQMSKQEDVQKSDWLNHVNKITSSKPSGTFQAKDKHDKPVILEWIKTDLISPEYATAMKSAWPIACPTYTQVEMQFLRAHPEVVGSDTFFKPFEPLFKAGVKNVDWALIEEKMQEVLKSIFLWDSSTCNDEMKKTLTNSTHIFVTVKDKATKELLGFISFLVIPEYADGDVKCIAFAVKTEAQNRGLGKLLMSSILNIIPDLKRIFLCTRITNNTAQNACHNWGFVKDLNPVVEEHNYTFNINHWLFMEYKATKADILQKTANSLLNIK